MAKAATWLTSKNILIKNKFLSKLLNLFKTCQDKRVMSSILKIIYNISCIPELKNLDDRAVVYNPEMSPIV